MSDQSRKADNANIIRLSGLLALALGVFGLLVGAVLMYASIQGQLRAEQATNDAQAQAREIAESLNQIQAALSNPEVIEIARAVLDGDASQTGALEAAVRRRGVSNIIDLEVFPEAVEAIPLGDYPEPDFTVIEMLLEARSEGRAPIQVHYPGQSIENLALAQAVEFDAGVEGILFLRVPVSMASSLLSFSSFLDSASIVQGGGANTYALRSFGQPNSPVESTPIPGSRLTLNWTRRTFANSVSKQSAVVVLSIGVILLMIGLLIRKRFGALQTSEFLPKRRPAKSQDNASSSSQAQPEGLRSARKVRVKPLKSSRVSKPAAAPSAPDPILDDLPDWLLDSDQIDQSDAPLGGRGESENDLPDLPDTLSESVDDTVGIENRMSPEDSGMVADTVFLDKDEHSLFEPEEGRYLADDTTDASAEARAEEGGAELDDTALSEPAEPVSEDDDFPARWLDSETSKRETATDGVDFDVPEEDTSQSSIDPIEELESATDNTMDWEDFKNDVESDELLTAGDEQDIDDALADLDDEPTADSAAPVESPEADTPTTADDPATGDDQTRAMDAPAQVADPVPSESQPASQSSATAVLDPSLFMASSIGGIVGKNLDARAATLIGESIGSEARERGIERLVVGRDGRLDGATLMSSLTQGLQSAGVSVVDLGAVPLPVLNFAAAELTDGSGVMVTGSHYPPEHNGFRIRLNHELLHESAIQSIRQRIDKQELSSGSGGLEEESVIERYVERIGIDIQLERPLKVVVDCGNGIAGTVVPSVLGAIGADVIPLYADVDGTFPNHLPDPSNPDNLEDLKLCVRNFQADIGLAFDGDGDRMVMISGEGEVVWTDRVLMLLAPEILERNPGARVIIDSASSVALSELIQAAGGKAIIERSAEAFVDRRMQKENALLGGLFSGHLFVAERWYPFDDAIYASARLLELLAADTRTISEILEQLPPAAGTPELRIPMEAGQAEELITALIAEGEFGDGKLSMVDGLRVDYPDGWGLVRASHRGQDLVLRFEADSTKALNRIKTVFMKQVKALGADVGLLA